MPVLNSNFQKSIGFLYNPIIVAVIIVVILLLILHFIGESLDFKDTLKFSIYGIATTSAILFFHYYTVRSEIQKPLLTYGITGNSEKSAETMRTYGGDFVLKTNGGETIEPDGKIKENDMDEILGGDTKLFY